MLEWAWRVKTMADYDLSRLSSRSFEQLIQALAIKTIGPGVVPFGDGPDGGRDATFNGSFPYPSADGGWEGYGVIQAKYLQRSRDPRQDGAWVVSQLREELEKYCEPERKRRKPDYFVLATNVALTAVGEKGSKDRVASVLKEFQKRLSLKGFTIWDYDQIRVFLDNNEDVRNSNAAWITPGDVLVRIVETLSPRTPNFGSTLRNYLQKEMLNDEFVNLEQAGHDASERIPLGSVFVDLPVYVDRGSLKDAIMQALVGICQKVKRRKLSMKASSKKFLRCQLNISTLSLSPSGVTDKDPNRYHHPLRGPGVGTYYSEAQGRVRPLSVSLSVRFFVPRSCHLCMIILCLKMCKGVCES